MHAPATPRSAKPTLDSRVARLFGLTADDWRRHANPVSTWTRFGVLALLAISIWSRAWSAWWYPARIALCGARRRPRDHERRQSLVPRPVVLLFEDVKARDRRYAAWERR